MKNKQLILTGCVSLALASAACADLTVNITGATAFRAAATFSIIAYLGGTGVTTFAFDTNTGTTAGGSNRSIFRGTVSGLGVVTVRASWSGSTAGIAAVAAGTPVQVFLPGTTLTTAGNGFAAAGTNFETAPASFAFSDVAQAASNTLSPILSGTQVGVVPFEFMANQSAHAVPLMNNMTDQIMASIYSTSQVPLRVFTGALTDVKKVFPTGRNNGSGSRATVLGETRFGFFTGVQQYRNFETGGHNGPGPIDKIDFALNGGNSSNSFLRDLMKGTSGAVDLYEDVTTPNPTPGGPPIVTSTKFEDDVDCLLITYLTRSDAISAAVDPDGAGPQKGAKPLTYNGVPYSDDAVKTGAYTLWGYQWLYQAPTISADEVTFRNAFTTTIPNNLGTAAIPIPLMKATRAGGDGGPITPNFLP